MEPLLGQIILFSGNFAPRGWAFCDGQLLPIAQNSALFSILGTVYGGDGRTTFGLPDLRGRAPIGPRNGPGLSDYRLGQKGGVETVTLNQTQIPSHSHTAGTTVQINIGASSGNASISAPTNGSTLAQPGSLTGRVFNGTLGYNNETPNVALNGGNASTATTTIGNTGGNLSHENRSPFLAINYIVALVGVFPSRS